MRHVEKVKSSMISEVAYDTDENTLHITFPNGKEYVYRDVSPAVHAELMSAESIGTYFSRNIRGKFPHSMVVEEGA